MKKKKKTTKLNNSTQEDQEKSNLHIVHELCRDQDAGNEQAMNVEGINRKQRLSLREAVEVNVGNDEARRAAICVLEDPLEVALQRDCGSG